MAEPKGVIVGDSGGLKGFGFAWWFIQIQEPCLEHVSSLSDETMYPNT